VRRLAYSIILLILLGESSLALKHEPLPYGARLDSHLEFRENKAALLTLKLSIPVTHIVFRREGDVYRSSLRTAVTLRDRDSGQEISQVFRENLKHENFAAVRDPEAFFETDYTMEVLSGDLDVEVLIYGRGPYLPWRESFPLELPSPGSHSFFLQGPVFKPNDHQAGTPAFGFFDPWNISPRHSIFLDGFAGELNFITELRVWEDRDSLELILVLEGREGEVVHYERRVVPGSRGGHPLRWTLPLDDLSMGPLRVTVSVIHGSERQDIHGKLEMGLGPPAFDRDWLETLQLLSLIADDEEIELMEAAEPERRHGVFLEFWERRDSNHAESNPAMESFFHDLDFIGRNYGTAWTPGWRSDRGKIYLEYGPPHQVDQIEEEVGFRRREIWRYAGGMSFIFEDRHGQGDYELVERWSQ
jgi:GWxTD domain-containing protein